MNALDDAMFAALIETGERLKTEAGVRAVVLSGEGRAFCAGLDMGSFQAMASGERRGERDPASSAAYPQAHRRAARTAPSTPAWSGARSPCR